MLMIRRPAAFQCIAPCGVCSDQLGEKIRANYRLIGMNITCGELLHMTVQKPDIYIGLENRASNFELVNQFLNRIMMYHSAAFTYQDEVFVASVLQKLGVYDTKEFMGQVSRHMDRSRLLVQLVGQYAGRERDTAQKTEEETSAEHFSEQRFCNAVFNRQMTAECNRILYAYACHNQPNVRDSAARCAAWIEQADAVQLLEQRGSAYWHGYIYYETKPFGKNELNKLIKEKFTKEKIVQRTAAAVLENLIQKISYDRQRQNSGYEWQNYAASLYRSADDVIERLRYFQSERITDIHAVSAYERQMRELTEHELGLTGLLEFVDSEIFYLQEQTGKLTQMQHTSLESDRKKEFSDAVREDARLYERMRENIVHSILENRDFQRQLTQNVRSAEQISGLLPDEKGQETERRIETEIETGRQIQGQKQTPAVHTEDISILLKKFFAKYEPRYREMYKEQSGYIKSIGHTAHIKNVENIKNIGNIESIESIENIVNIENMENIGNTQTTENAVSYEMHSAENGANHKDYGMISDKLYHQENRYHDIYLDSYITEFLNQNPDILQQRDIPLMENIKLLERINEHNVSMKQLYESSMTKNDTNVIDSETDYTTFQAAVSEKPENNPSRVVVDAVQARHDALRILENPQEILNEIYESAAEIKREMPEEIACILRITDEPARIFYEQLLGFQEEYRQTIERNDANVIIKKDSHSLRKNADVIIDSDSRSPRNDADVIIENDSRSLRNDADVIIENDNRSLIKTAELYNRQKENDKNFEKTVSQLINEKHTETLQLQKDVNSLLHQIQGQEQRLAEQLSAYSAEIKQLMPAADWADGDAPQSIIMSQIDNSRINNAMLNAARNVMTAITAQYRMTNADTADRINSDFAQINFSHKTEIYQQEELVREIMDKLGQMDLFVDEYVSGSGNVVIRDRKSVADTSTIRDTQIIQKEIQDMKRELITQSEQQLAKLINHSLKTQVHTISDKVYLELERRLKNEQRRRGY